MQKHRMSWRNVIRLRFAKLILTLWLIVGGAYGQQTEETIRTWTGNNGKKIEAAFVELSTDASLVKLKMTDGQVIITQMNRLSPADQQFASDADRRRLDQLANDFYSAGHSFMDDLDGKQQDYGRAREMFRNAANLGHGGACFMLGIMYREGFGGEKDLEEARRCFQKAAHLGDTGGQMLLGDMYRDGLGVKQDIPTALSWYRKAADAGDISGLLRLGALEITQDNLVAGAKLLCEAADRCVKEGDQDGLVLTTDTMIKLGFLELAQPYLGKALAGNETTPRAAIPPKEVNGAPVVISSGTAWFCSKYHVVTCWHVVSSAMKYSLVTASGEEVPLQLVARDPQNDLAVLELQGNLSFDPGVLPISTRPPRPASSVFTIGYPHTGLLGKNPKYTEGTISSLTGLDDDIRVMQVSVPVQSGNSGGPLLDDSGFVIGVIASKLAAAQVFQWTGDMPQNVNYALKSIYLKALLEARAIPHALKTEAGTQTARSDLVERLSPSVCLILGWK
jgi:hypothetical protein